MKSGLILEGGAMRGLFTAGVLDVLMENNIKFDGLIGVSAGAAFGCNYKSGQIGRTLRYNKRFCKNKNYCSLYSLIKTGDVFGYDFCYHKIPEIYDIFDCDAHNKNPMEFYSVCTDIVTGKPVYKLMTDAKDKNYIKWICASASMPFVSNIVEIDGGKYLDGGISDSIPVKYFESIGYDKNVVVLTRPEDYIKKERNFKKIMNLKYKKYPKLVEAFNNRPKEYNETVAYIKEQESIGNLFVIRPEKSLEVGHIEHNPDVLQRVYDEGRHVMENNLQKLVEYLNN